MTSTEILLAKAMETIATLNASVTTLATQRDAIRASEQAALVALGALRYRLNEFVAMIEDRPTGDCPSDDALIDALAKYVAGKEHGR